MLMAEPAGERRGTVAVVAGLALGVGGLVAAAAVLDERRPAGSPGAVVTPRPPASASVERDRARQVPDGLLPNVRSLLPRNISVRTERGRRVLRFDATLANTGTGPLELVPQPARRCPAGQRHAAQRVYQDADGDTRYDRAADRRSVLVPSGCMLFHRAHEHWHLDASARYALTGTDPTQVFVAQDKVSFCLRDNRRVTEEKVPVHRRAYGDCARDRVQGITAGWADVYRARLPGQALRLPASVGDGVYCLRVRADPLDVLVESVEDDNEVVRAIRITGMTVTPGPPRSCG
jgi:hypothetical protein